MPLLLLLQPSHFLYFHNSNSSNKNSVKSLFLGRHMKTSCMMLSRFLLLPVRKCTTTTRLNLLSISFASGFIAIAVFSQSIQNIFSNSSKFFCCCCFLVFYCWGYILFVDGLPLIKAITEISTRLVCNQLKIPK